MGPLFWKEYPCGNPYAIKEAKRKTEKLIYLDSGGMDRFGRRPNLLVGGVCMVIAHLIIAVLVSQYSTSWATHQAAAWTSVAFLLFFMLTFGATWGPIPWAMPAEIFPASLRAKGVSYSTMSNWLNNFIIGLITPPLIQNTGYGTYVFFCVFCLLAIVWVWFVVPEVSLLPAPK